MLYSIEQFEAKMEELIQHGYPFDAAYDLVREQEILESDEQNDLY